jgi:HAD superfamily hydrolase (TIGR01450 family)
MTDRAAPAIHRLNKSQLQRLSEIRCWLLDMDGTVTLGEEALPGADRFFQCLRLAGAGHIFLTNNSSHSAGHYLERLARIGLPASRSQILTSTDALAFYLKTIGQSGQPVRVYPVGTPEFVDDLTQAGIGTVSGRRRVIDFVVLAFDTSLVYEKLDIACDYILHGTPYLATNPDRVCPMPGDQVLPDCGALIAFMETCTGKPPLKVIGKPGPLMAEMILAEHHWKREELAMVGDRIYTDLAFAQNAGILSVAVLTGEASREQIEESGVQPDFIFPGIGDLADCLKELCANN